MCGTQLNDRKKSEEYKCYTLEPAGLMTKRSRLKWSCRVERKDDTNWVKRCMTLEVEQIRQRVHP